ncbi:hypothetical protein N7468_007962 [Penicillium chermesinum]|uniref:Uncharacterized protein n=1 Tax=Penicillium chermesinum TaxID=63820 RepID=A0A9W9NNU8_9EURO|nr:uncharacterized protein N7468_007962 [Penicillium chermesinum]KAJ5223420.1 hypothetical protein N7468_007962 [Penicillium chermesinum]KAJ6155744.1 hypothetical protein N7470_006310 [Penicillium chermesinum]
MALSMAGTLSRWPRAAHQSAMIFSQVRCASTVPHFKPTQSPELDQALDYYRQNLFIPFSLPKRQKQTVFQEKHRKRLLDDPISFNISETEEYTLRPISLWEVRQKNKVNQVLDMMIEANDFQNFGAFVRGMHNAGLRISSSRWEKLIRKIGAADQLHILLGCARRQSEIGLDLQQIGVLESLFYQFHRMAAKADFKGEQVTKALHMARQTVDLIEFYGIQNLEATSNKLSTLPASQPFVIATLLELSAARAIDEFGGKDQDGEALKYVRKLLANWDLVDLKPSPEADMNQWIGRTVSIHNGLKLSLSIQDLSLDKELQSRVKSHLTKTKNALSQQLKNELLEQKLNYNGKLDLELAKNLVSK